MLGNGELIGELDITWDELLNHGDEPFSEKPISHSRTATNIW
jgi:hypothetical protein